MSAATRLLVAFPAPWAQAGADLAAADEDGPGLSRAYWKEAEEKLRCGSVFQDGRAPAHQAARSGHLEALRLLLEAGPQTSRALSMKRGASEQRLLDFNSLLKLVTTSKAMCTRRPAAVLKGLRKERVEKLSGPRAGGASPRLPLPHDGLQARLNARCPDCPSQPICTPRCAQRRQATSERARDWSPVFKAPPRRLRTAS